MEKRTIAAAGGALLALALSEAACSKKEPPTLDQVRPVMEKFLDAQRDNRGSRGVFWRDAQPKFDRQAAITAIGVDVADAPDFEWSMDPPESGMDPKLRVTARGKGEFSNLALVCVQEANAPKADCTEEQ
jgi:hypothetical protein